jgi:hypothetical protein
MNSRHCIHDWGPPERVGHADVRWCCRRCGELRAASGDKPLPGTFLAASEDFSNALRNLGLEILTALPRPIRRLFRKVRR